MKVILHSIEINQALREMVTATLENARAADEAGDIESAAHLDAMADILMQAGIQIEWFGNRQTASPL